MLNAAEPIVVSYGMGVDSTAILVGLRQRGIRPDAVLFADVGSEQEHTYAYLPVINEWLESVGFPKVTVVRYVPKKFKYEPYHTLCGNCLANRMLPSLAYGRKGCSLKWKAAPLDRQVEGLEVCRKAWKEGRRIQRLIGYDCSAADTRRFTKAKDRPDNPRYEYVYPLREWGLDRDACKALIASAGLPVPPKSSCFFCPSMKKEEVRLLSKEDMRAVVAMEHVAGQGSDTYYDRKTKAWKPRTVKGLWRSKSMTDFIVAEGLMAPEEIQAVRQASDRDRMSFARNVTLETQEVT